MPEQTFSFTSQTWNRLKKNTGALFGLGVISMAVFIAVFGYLLTPDASPNADLQTVEIQAKKPGYSQLFLKIPEKHSRQVGWFTQLVMGNPDDYRYLPITSYAINGDELRVNKYIDEDTS